MMLASVEGTIITAVIAVVMLLIRWFGDRNSQSAAGSSENKPDARPSAGPKSRSEEERMRRFLDALGIPAEGTEAPESKRAVSTMRESQPSMRRESPIKPVPPIVAREIRIPAPKKQPPPIPGHNPVPEARRVLERARDFSQRSADEAPAPTTPAALITIPALKTAESPEFETLHSKYSTASDEGFAVRSVDSSTEGGDRLNDARLGGSTEFPLWREALRSPEVLRSAFILKEILGPPRGLQSINDPHTFPSR